MIERLTYLAGQLHFMQAPLDRDTWLDDREGMDFSEAPPEVPEFDLGMPVAPVADWVVLFRYFAIAVLAALLVFVIVRLIARNRAKTAGEEGNVAEVDSTEEGPNRPIAARRTVGSIRQKPKRRKTSERQSEYSTRSS